MKKPTTDVFVTKTSAAVGNDIAARLLSLSDRYGLSVEIIAVAGAYIAIAGDHVSMAGRSEVLTAIGKGFDRAGAVLGCLGEVAEFRSSLYRPDRDAPRLVPPPVAAAARLDPARLAGAAVDWPADLGLELANPDETRRIWAPAPACLARMDWHFDLDPAHLPDSNGAAAGASRTDAIRRALLETIERDATAIWWRAAALRPALARTDHTARLEAGLAAHSGETGRMAWLLDLTTDIGVPVVACVSVETDGSLPALGVAARTDRRLAAEAAFLEMLVSELNLAALFQRLDADETPSGYDQALSDWYAAINLDTAPHLAPADAVAAPVGVAADASGFAPFVDALATVGVTPWVVDLERDDIGVPVVKVLCPGLAHYRGWIGADRLARVPRDLGWPTALAARTRHFPFDLLI